MPAEKPQASNTAVASKAHEGVIVQLERVKVLASQVASKAARGKLNELAEPLADLLTAGATLVAYQQILASLGEADV